MWKFSFHVEFACSLRVHVGFPTIRTCMLGSSPVSTPDRGTGSDSGVGPCTLRCGCPLLLRDGLNAESTFPCTLYMRPVKDLYLHVSP